MKIFNEFCVPCQHYVSTTCFTDTFQSKMKICRWNKWTRMKKTNRIQSHVVGLLAYYRQNTNEAIWPERQVNEECWLKKRAECRIKGLSCSLWAMLCADSCFNKTLSGGSGYQVASDKKAHDKKGRGFTRGGLVHTWAYTNRHIEHIKHSYTIRITHREE